MCPLLDPTSVSLEDPHRTTRHGLSSFVVVPPLGLPPTLTAAEVSRRSQCSWSRGNLGATLRVAGEQPAKIAENPFADTFFPTLFPTPLGTLFPTPLGTLFTFSIAN